MSNRLYNTVTFLTMPLIKYRLRERFGKSYVQQRLDGGRGPTGTYDVMIHAASVGEQQLVRPILDALSKADKRVLLTAATDTGLARAMQAAEMLSGVDAGYLPLDRPAPMKRFFHRVQARKLVLVETEIWPNLMAHAGQQGCEIILINGRLSDGSFRNYRRFRFALIDAFRSIDRCLVRSPEDGTRFHELGVPAERVRVTGNLKLCQRPEATPVDLKTDRPVVVFGSTREEEEALILEVAGDLFANGGLSAVFAPRHPERCETVQSEMEQAGLRVITSRDREAFRLASGEAVLVNETGRLLSFYRVADLCFVGGSLVPKGGQNFVEPMYFGKPVVTGVHLDNFRDLLPHFDGAMTVVETVRELRFVLERFGEYPEAFRKMGERGRERLKEDQDALEKTMEVLL